MALPQPRRWKGPDAIKSRAEAGGWRRGEHLESDKETGIWRYDPKVEYQQDAVLRVYATWRWDQSDQEESYEECVKRFLCPGAPLPQMHELKCFWRFYQKQSKGLLCKHPTVDTLKNRMKQLNGGLHRYTKQRLEGTTVSEINHFLKRLMPYEDGSETRDVHRPKYNFKPPDLKRLLNSLWNKPDLHYIHERDRIQFHLKLIWFASTGGRIGGLLKKGIPYKDIHLVLRRTDAGEPYFIYQLDQRYYKNNPDPKNKTQGNAETDYPVLLLDSVSLILTLAIADDALSLKDLTAMLRGKGEGPVDWNEHALDVPICRHIHRNGDVDPNESMHEDRLRQILSQLLEKEAYVGVAPRIHSIRREVGRQLDKLYTPVERSQHVGQADLNVWGRSYVAAVSSCDGLRAFLREKTNHEAVEYFQGIERFRQPGLPTTLPAARRDQLRQQAKQEPHTPFRKLEQMALKAYQQDCLRQLRQDSLFGRGRQQACGADPDLLNSIMPEKGQVAKLMARTTPLSVEERLLAICCMVSLATSYQGVFYRPGEEPCDGRCPYCQTALNSIKTKRILLFLHGLS
ncbi:hypothetical protein EDB81DRAFT_17988 [Dactylonectria macrodidyma]|uniref:Uncharacterized protein n=1 Tax=Dactylonectria macrodidyma TaxID=307937 RepID=A0A9P9JQW7_9HYPO|nr:hypothetical protein EDB81DRAFT_17988 [Dactylonectria macrodidyma]